MSGVPESSVATACVGVAQLLSSELAGSSVRILIGTPAAAEKTSTAEHRINLFFYRFEPWGFDESGPPGSTGWLRAHCVITAFAVEETPVSAGENDLRLLGEVMRIFRQKPVIGPLKAGDQSFTAQIVFQTLSVDDIDRLWSTQRDVAYRPSVAYEIALVPVVPSTRAIEPPLAGAALVAVQPIGAPGAPSPRPARRFVLPVVDTARADWAPAIGLVDGAELTDFLAFEGKAPASVDVTIAGAGGATVNLAWEIWDGAAGWRAAGSPTAVILTGASTRQSVAFPAFPAGAKLPQQALLYATRSFHRAGDPAGFEITLRSNPLLIALYPGATP